VNAALKAEVLTQCKTPGIFALTFYDGPSDNIPALLLKLT
jgi:peptidoglycan/xylan/chitin deacetylase (PgdA/CDA1 family)